MRKVQTIKEEKQEVMIQDIMGQGFTYSEAEAELDLLVECEEEIDYIRVSRVGKTVRLSRSDRKVIFNNYKLVA